MHRIPLVWLASLPLLFAGDSSGSGSQDLPLRQPVVRSVFPLGGQTGHRVPVEIEGDFLDRAGGVRCECDDVRASIRTASAVVLQVELEIPPAARPGPRTLYVETPRGTSNRFLFRVTRWTSVVEREPNDTPDTAQRVVTPAVVEGRVARLTDTDFFRFHADAGERVALNVMAARSRAPGYVSLTLLSADGHELAHNNGAIGPDPYLDYTFRQAGDYLVVLTARRFADFFSVVKDDQTINWQYQLAIGRSPMPWSVFPAGGRRGSAVNAELRADFLGAEAVPEFSGKGVEATLAPGEDSCRCRYTLAIQIAPDAEPGVHYLTFPDDSGNTQALGFVVSDLPEILEAGTKPQPIQLPAVVNGRIDSPGEQDAFSFNANQDDELTFEVEARGLGSRMTDPQIALLRADGNIVEFGDDRCRKCSGFYESAGRKKLLDPEFTHLFISANPNDADATGVYHIVVLDNSSRGSRDQTYRLAVRKKEPGFEAGVAADHLNARAEGRAKIPVTVVRKEGFQGEIELTPVNLPSGWNAKPSIIPTGRENGELEISRQEDSPRSASFRIDARAKPGGHEISRLVALPPLIAEDGLGYLELPRMSLGVSFVESSGFLLNVEEPATGFSIDPRQKAQVEVICTVEGPQGLREPVVFELENPPAGITLKTRQITPDGKKAILALEADAQRARLGRYRIAVRATTRLQGREIVEVTPGFRLQVK